jgi:hypothetical protein
MTAIGDLAKLLIVGGLSAEHVAQALDLAQLHAQEVGGLSADVGGLSADSVTEKRRAYDRGRQAEIRRAKKDQHILTSLPSSLSDSQEKKEGVVGRAKSSRGTRLPDDWQPTQADLNFAVCHIPEGVISDTAAQFRDHWHAKTGQDACKMDWSAAWRTWVRNAKRFAARAGPAGFTPRPGSKEDRAERNFNALQKFKQFANGSHAPDQPGPSGDADRPDARGLPFLEPE